MKGLVSFIIAFLIVFYANASSSILKIGDLTSINQKWTENEKLLKPRKEGGVVMLIRDSLPEYIVLIDSSGQVEKTLKLDDRHIDYQGLFVESGDIVQLSSGNYVLTTQNLSGSTSPYLKQVVLSSSLDIISTSIYNLGDNFRKIDGLYNSKDDTYVAMFSTITGVKQFKCVKFNRDGSVVWSKVQNLPATVLALQRSKFMGISDDNGYSYHTFILSYISTNILAINKYWFLSYVLDQQGSIQHTFSHELKEISYIENEYPSIHGCMLEEDGKYSFSFAFKTNISPFVKIYSSIFPGNVSKETLTLDHVYGKTTRSFLSDIGNVISFGHKHLYVRTHEETRLIEIIPIDQNDIRHISYLYHSRRPDGDWWVAGVVEYLDGQKKDILIGLPLSKYHVKGNVFKDYTKDVTFDGSEDQFHAPWVKFKSTFNYYTKIDTSGDYDIRLAKDEYEVFVKTDSDIWVLNEGSKKVTIDTSIHLNLPIEPVVFCPEMTVNLVTPVLVRCQENIYEVNFSNSGSEVALNAYVEIELDQHLNIISSTLPYEMIENGKLKFNLGNVPVDSSGQFFFTAYLDCENTVSGQTHCTQAKIYPNAYCFELEDCWDGSYVEIIGECVNDTAYFDIKNIGDRAIQDKVMFVLEDDIMIGNPIHFQLNKNETKTFAYNSRGNTIRVEVPQSECSPYRSIPSKVIEGCGGLNQLGFVRTLPQDDDDRFVSANCNESIEDIDNYYLKADPKGYGNRNYISDSTEIQYTYIFKTGFENGLFLTDTISELLNVESFKVNSSSHPFEYTLFNNGVIKIDLSPKADVPYGYFQYSISPRKGLPEGSVIQTKGAFYLNSATPIMTNQVYHTIGYNFIEVLNVTTLSPWKESVQINAYPNPFQNSFSIDIRQPLDGVRLEVYNMSGQMILQKNLNAHQFIQAENWTAGQYIFRLIHQDQVISTGRLVKH